MALREKRSLLHPVRISHADRDKRPEGNLAGSAGIEFKFRA
jgi:hypothetical protein